MSGDLVKDVLIAIDDSGAALFWNQNDITISALCRVVQLADSGNQEFKDRLYALALWDWQVKILRELAPKLDALEPNHCELARQNDIKRAERIVRLLTLP